MIAGSSCDCLVCRLEKSLLAEFGDAGTRDNRLFITPANDALSAFPTYLDLIAHLHAPADASDSSSTDNLLLALLKQHASAVPSSLSQRLLLLAFIPTIHRTASQITAMFPSLARDDISQQVLSLFLEFLRSAELRTRRSRPRLHHCPESCAEAPFAGPFVNPGGQPLTRQRRILHRPPLRSLRKNLSPPKDNFSSSSTVARTTDGCLSRNAISWFSSKSKARRALSSPARTVIPQSPFNAASSDCLTDSRRVAQMPRREVPRQLRLFPR